MALGPVLIYCAFAGYCYLVNGHRPIYGGPRYGFWGELVGVAAVVFWLASPIGAFICGVVCWRSDSWPPRLAAGIVLVFVAFTANYILYTVDPYGVTVWLQD